MSDHMKSPTDLTRTRCNQSIDRLHGPRIRSWKYGSPKTTCESCLRLYAKDLSGRVRDSSDSVRDSSDSVRDSSDSVRDSSDSVRDSSDQDNILFILIGLKDILFGVTVTSAVFYGFQEIPHLDFITSSFITLLVICLAIYLRQRQLAAGGDDQ